MAEETMLDKAMAMIPGMGPAKKKPARKAATSTASHISNLKKGIAKLTRDLERLVGMVGKDSKKAKTASGKGGAKRTAAKAAPKKRGAARKTTRKA
jgi:hypothetical protein